MSNMIKNDQKIKNYMIKNVPTFVSGVQESVLVDFIIQHKVKILYKVKTCQNRLHQKFPNPYKNAKKFTFFCAAAIKNFQKNLHFFEFLSCY